MALTDTFVKNVKHTGSPAGDKHADERAMYLLVILRRQVLAHELPHRRKTENPTREALR